MTKRISSISPLQAGIVYAALMACVSIVIFVPVFFIISLAGGIASHNGVAGPASNNPVAAMLGGGIAMVIIVPIIYTIMGFIVGVIGAVIYNLIAKLTGGIEITLTDPSGAYIQ